MEDIKTTIFSIIVVMVIVLYVIVTDCSDSPWHKAGDLPDADGQYVAIDGDGDIFVLEFSFAHGWSLPDGVDVDGLAFDLESMVGWQEIER